MAKKYHQPLPLSSCRYGESLFGRDAHRGLIWDRFFEGYEDDFSGFLEIKEKKQNHEIVIEAQSGKADFIKRFNGNLDYEKAGRLAERSALLAQALSGWVGRFACEGRFVTGMGNDHPTENGFTWHRTLGAPYLPGAAVKGLLRGWLEWQWGSDAIKKNGDILKRTQLLQWFGSEHKDAKQQNHQPQSGWFIFFDALPVGEVKIAVDVMTPHYGKWYEDGGKESNDKTIPADWHSPVPISYLTVRQVRLQFTIAIRPGLAEQERLLAQSALPSVILSLEEALQWGGAGAKTAGGYGRFTSAKQGVVSQNFFANSHQAYQAQRLIDQQLKDKEQNLRQYHKKLKAMEQNLKKRQNTVSSPCLQNKIDQHILPQPGDESAPLIPKQNDHVQHKPCSAASNKTSRFSRLKKWKHSLAHRKNALFVFFWGASAVISLSWSADLLKEGPNGKNVFVLEWSARGMQRLWDSFIEWFLQLGWIQMFWERFDGLLLTERFALNMQPLWNIFVGWQPSLTNMVYISSLAVSITLFVMFSWLGWRNSKNLLPLRSLSKPHDATPHKVLIIPLSTPGRVEKDANVNRLLDKLENLLDDEWSALSWNEFLTVYRKPISLTTEKGETQSIEIKRNWNGDNLILMLERHQEELQRLVLITSQPKGIDPKCYDQVYRLKLFEKIIKQLFPKVTLIIRKDSDAVDFDDIDDLYHRFSQEIELAIKENYNEHEILLDFTGGMKATSIAAALATLHHRDIEVQYIHTDVSRKILAYNMQSMPARRD